MYACALCCQVERLIEAALTFSLDDCQPGAEVLGLMTKNDDDKDDNDHAPSINNRYCVNINRRKSVSVVGVGMIVPQMKLQGFRTQRTRHGRTELAP